MSENPRYVEGHTHLSYLAARWPSKQSGLLGSKELQRADEWLSDAKQHGYQQPRLTDAILGFIEESRRALRRRRYKTSALLVACLSILIIGYLSYQWWLSRPTAGIDIQLKGDEEVIALRTRDGVTRLRSYLKASVPDKNNRNSLLIATWNIRNLGAKPRPDEALHYIAEIISHFDVVAIQELKADLSDYNRIHTLLGRGWRSLESDINEGSSGNNERLAFLYDSRKVTLGRLVGELGLASSPLSVGQPFRSPYFVGFEFSGIKIAFCNVHLRWGRRKQERPLVMKDIAAGLSRKVGRGRDFPANLVLLGDVQGGSVNGEILEAIEAKGFSIPKGLRELPSSALLANGLPYDQIALLIDKSTPLEASNMGVVDYYQHVFREDQEASYQALMGQFRVPRYQRYRSYFMSDHLPKWLELVRTEEPP